MEWLLLLIGLGLLWYFVINPLGRWSIGRGAQLPVQGCGCLVMVGGLALTGVLFFQWVTGLNSPSRLSQDEQVWVNKANNLLQALDTDQKEANRLFDEVKGNTQILTSAPWINSVRDNQTRIDADLNNLIDLAAPKRFSKAQSHLSNMAFGLKRYWNLYIESVNSGDRLVYDSAVEQLNLASQERNAFLEEIKLFFPQ